MTSRVARISKFPAAIFPVRGASRAIQPLLRIGGLEQQHRTNQAGSATAEKLLEWCASSGYAQPSAGRYACLQRYPIGPGRCARYLCPKRQDIFPAVSK